MAEEENKKKKKNSIFTGFGINLTLMFVIFKLFGVIQWSWIIVLMPLWFPFVIIILLLIIMYIPILFIDCLVYILGFISYIMNKK